MPKVDTYFDDLTSCSLFGFLEQKRPTEKSKAYSVYKGTLISIAKDDTTKPKRRTLAQACLNVFEEQTKSVPVEQYWMDLAKYKLENEIYLEESQHVLDATKDTREQGRLLRKTITKRFEKRSVSEVEDKSDDDFIPVRQLKRKKVLSLPKKSKESVSSSSGGVPNPSSSSLLREQVKTTNTNTDDDNGDFISSNKSTISRSHWKDTSSSSLQSLGPHTPPRQIYSTSENQNLLVRLKNEKQQAKSTMEPICSNIVDTTNKNLMERLQYQYDHRWELVTNDATKYIDKLIENSDTRNDLRNILLLPFIPSGETYSFNKHYEVHWVHRFVDKLSLFFEAPRNPLLDKNSEGWLNCHIFAPLIDDCFLTCEEIHVHRCEEMSLASIMRKNLTREESEKKSSGHKIDIIFRVDDVEYFSAETYVDEDPQNSKPISYKRKLFREMKDQLDRLLKKLEFTKESIKEVKNIFVHGMLHGGLNGKIYAMYYNIDLEYYFVYEMCRYRIGTTWSSVPDSLMTLKKILCLKYDINKVLGVIKKVKKVRLYSKPEDLFSINNLPDTTPSPKKKQNK